ncbi:hypothetical protein N7530_008807 [Penicillium desertorum]|uniref:Uncharacterized protein n=1 Tax=Penicillium desertorum TaxID=1303715 RepID=A0A9W9WPS9_9EURO|nr:hypothetical protein N7530_008807 [Penicillium desertorum]
MPDLKSTVATTAQVAKAAQRGVRALFENIQASGRTGKLLNEVGRQLLPVKKRLESITSEVEGTYSYDIKDRRLALKRITRESEAYELGTQYYRNVIGELLSEISRLRGGQPVYTEEEGQLPIDGINSMAGDHQFPQRDASPSRGRIAAGHIHGETNFSDIPEVMVVRFSGD